MINLPEKISSNSKIDGLDFFIAKNPSGMKCRLTYLNGSWEENMISYADCQKKFFPKIPFDVKYVRNIIRLAKRCGLTAVNYDNKYITYFCNNGLTHYENVTAPLYYEENGAYHFYGYEDTVYMVSYSALMETEIAEKMFLECVRDYEFLYELRKEIDKNGYFISKIISSNLILRYIVIPINENEEYIYLSKSKLLELGKITIKLQNVDENFHNRLKYRLGEDLMNCIRLL